MMSRPSRLEPSNGNRLDLSHFGRNHQSDARGLAMNEVAFPNWSDLAVAEESGRGEGTQPIIYSLNIVIRLAKESGAASVAGT